MTRGEAIHIVDVAFGVPQAVRRADENRTYFEDEIREAKGMALKALEQEPSEDCISREQALKVFAEKCAGECACCEYNGSGYDTAENCKLIKSLPSVNPQPKTGYWIHFASGDDCSECGWSTGKYISPSKYCPGCGAKMEG